MTLIWPSDGTAIRDGPVEDAITKDALTKEKAEFSRAHK